MTRNNDIQFIRTPRGSFLRYEMSNAIQIIIPTIKKDYLRMRDLVPKRVFRYLPVSELIFIGNAELGGIVRDDISARYEGLSVRYIDEEEILPRQKVVDLIKARVAELDEEISSRVRPGWYYQQFLKMIFARRCEGEYYMSWDMDTVPLRNRDFFDVNGRPFFDLKSEYNPGYFRTIETLLGLSKNVEGSFVAEHMVFGRTYMEGLIEAIENTSLEGDRFWEKIIAAVDDDYITLGFSEFETYGTFVTEKFPEAYGYRQFSSFRRGSWFVKESDLTEEDMEWLSKDYDAVTFENAEQIEDMVMLFRNPKYRNSMSAKKFYETIMESGYFGNYSNGRIEAGDWYAPV